MDWENLDFCNIPESIEHLPEKPGAYAIRWAPGGKPQQIQRVFEPDQSGILCFGETGKSLRRRLNCFRRAAGGENCPHAEGERYYRLNYNKNKRFPLGELQIGYATCADKKQAKEIEISWFNEYEILFGELPPLNRKRG